MPHIAISMFPGRNKEAKQALADETQSFIANELGIESKFVSVSIEDVPPESWEKNKEQFPEETLFVKPGI